jgi:hypothetical protein
MKMVSARSGREAKKRSAKAGRMEMSERRTAVEGRPQLFEEWEDGAAERSGRARRRGGNQVANFVDHESVGLRGIRGASDWSSVICGH